jgi:hypothetical protein
MVQDQDFRADQRGLCDIHVQGAREHNLKNIDVVIPRDSLSIEQETTSKNPRRDRIPVQDASGRRVGHPPAKLAGEARSNRLCADPGALPGLTG